MTLEDQIEDLGVDDALADVLREVAAQRAVEIGAEAGYLSVRPSHRHIGAYFTKKYVDVAVQPERSAAVAARLPGSRVMPRTTRPARTPRCSRRRS